MIGNRINIRELDTIKELDVGIIDVNCKLINSMMVVETVMLPIYSDKTIKTYDERRSIAYNCLKKFGIEKLENMHPNEITEDERVKLIIARAIVNKPSRLIVVDKITEEVLSIIKELGIKYEVMGKEETIKYIKAHTKKCCDRCTR